MALAIVRGARRGRSPRATRRFRTVRHTSVNRLRAGGPPRASRVGYGSGCYGPTSAGVRLGPGRLPGLTPVPSRQRPGPSATPAPTTGSPRRGGRTGRRPRTLPRRPASRPETATPPSHRPGRPTTLPKATRPGGRRRLCLVLVVVLIVGPVLLENYDDYGDQIVAADKRNSTRVYQAERAARSKKSFNFGIATSRLYFSSIRRLPACPSGL